MLRRTFLLPLSFPLAIALANGACIDSTDLGPGRDDATPGVPDGSTPDTAIGPDVTPPDTDVDAPVDDADAPGDVRVDAEPVVPPTHTGIVDKVDLLFVVDNSLDMAETQKQFAKQIEAVLAQFTETQSDPGSGKAVAPVRDLHVAVITSSIGSLGTSVCNPAVTGNTHEDDRGRLLPREKECGLEAGAVIRWTPDTGDAGAITSLVAARAACVIESARNEGCGYESTLEATYRFLVDPAPPLELKASCRAGASGDACSGEVVANGIDIELLKQRAAFLRPDSVVAVVMLTGEDDASFRGEGSNWLPLATGAGRMPRGFGACKAVPDGIQGLPVADLRTLYGCTSCIIDNKDAACEVPWSAPDPDARNLRAFANVQRFGFDFLWPTSRYVEAFTRAQVPGANGSSYPNPLFVSGKRALDMVVVAGVVGVVPSLVGDAKGNPRPAGQIDWEKILSPDRSKRDPHMIESITPRAGLPLFAGDRTVDPVHGGERSIPGHDDLQHACIRAVPEHGNGACDGSAAGLEPICSASGRATHTAAKPALRILSTLRGLGARGHVASVCASDYGAVATGIGARIQAARIGR